MKNIDNEISNYTARGRPQQYGGHASRTIYHSWHVRLRLVLVSVCRSADRRFCLRCLRCAVLLSRNMTSIALWILRSPRRLLLKLRHRRFPFFIQAVHDSLVNMLHRTITFLHRQKGKIISLDRDRIWIARTTDQRVDHGVTRPHNMTVLTVVIENVGLLTYKYMKVSN